MHVLRLRSACNVMRWATLTIASSSVGILSTVRFSRPPAGVRICPFSCFFFVVDICLEMEFFSLADFLQRSANFCATYSRAESFLHERTRTGNETDVQQMNMLLETYEKKSTTFGSLRSGVAGPAQLIRNLFWRGSRRQQAAEALASPGHLRGCVLARFCIFFLRVKHLFGNEVFSYFFRARR